MQSATCAGTFKKERPMKLNFDPNKNITTFDHILAQKNRVKDLNNIRKIVSNWYEVLLFRLGLINSFEMKFRDGKRVKISSPKDYFDFWNSEVGSLELLREFRDKVKIRKDTVEFKWGGLSKPIKLFYDTPKQLTNTMGLVKEQFFEEQYRWLDVKGKDVVDIGANIGDTAIYFALKNAKHVYAFEPYPYSYNLAVKNKKANGFEEKVTLLNEACGGKRGKIKIGMNYENRGGTDLKSFNKGKVVRIVTLKDIVRRFKINRGILKVDCEGCEYGIILNAKKETLKKFDQIMIEYHYGYKNLVKKLKETGFHVKIIAPIFYFNPEAENHNMIIGLIYAKLAAV
ncbi:MAG: FkbM family methyltransferase [Candidatus Micrarchaeaceae archaeon]